MNGPGACAACLTPAGRGAIAVIAVWGPQATEVVDRLFIAANGRPLGDQPLERIVFGRIGGEELVVCRRAGARAEVHCHGGSAAVEAILRLLNEQGARLADWQQYIGQASNDPIEAEARLSLATAPTERTATILLDQLQGALRREIEIAREHAAAGKMAAALEAIDALLARASVGLHLCQPFRVVLAGRPNVGKSSLVNGLLGYGRAITSDLPGTTRDVLTAPTALDGWPVELIDTAGLHTAAGELERQAIERAAREIQTADLVLWVSDASRPDEPDGGLAPLRTIPAAAAVLRAFNKADLVPSDGRRPVAASYVSALTGEGLERLIAEIVGRLVQEPPPGGAGVPFSERHLRLLQQARQMLSAGASTAGDAYLAELIAAADERALADGRSL